ncbi:MAG: peroxiredoxin family protein [Planctomycetota bacterium]|jgi:hypothetical protein
MRGMSTFEKEYEDKGVHIVAVNVLEPEADGKAWAASSGLDYDFAWISEADRKALGIEMVPAQVLVDKDGKVVWTSSFTSIAGGPDAVRQALDTVLK